MPPNASAIAGSWTSENDPVSFFLTHDPAQAAGLLGLTTVRYTDSLDAQLATTYLDHFKAGIAELGTRCVSLTDAVMAHTQDAEWVGRKKIVFLFLLVFCC